MKIYGWENLEKDGSNFLAADMDNEDFFKTFSSKVDEMTSELSFKNTVDIVYQKGRWFLNFNEAKKAMIDELLSEILWREEILRKISSVTENVFNENP